MHADDLDRGSSLPLYHQVKQLLLALLREQGLTAGSRLPGDHELRETLGVSRSVVRQALAELETEGVVERVKGRGTFVARRRTTEHLVGRLTGLHEEMAARGLRVTSLVRRQEVVPADSQIAATLEIEPGALVLVLERLRFVDGEPWVLTTTHLPMDVAVGLEDADFSEQSLYAVLETRQGIRLTHARRSVEAVEANEDTARMLGVPRGLPLLLLRSTTWAGPRPVEVFVAAHRGDRTRFEVELDRTRESGPDPGATAPGELEGAGV